MTVYFLVGLRFVFFLVLGFFRSSRRTVSFTSHYDGNVQTRVTSAYLTGNYCHFARRLSPSGICACCVNFIGLSFIVFVRIWVYWTVYISKSNVVLKGYYENFYKVMEFFAYQMLSCFKYCMKFNGLLDLIDCMNLCCIM